MNNRFEIIDNFITNAKQDFSGVILERKLKNSKSGLVVEIEDKVYELSKDLKPLSDKMELTDTMELAIANGRPVWDEERATFYEPFFGQERLIILGAGHVAVCLTKMAKMIGMKVCVVDDREDFANKERFPLADKIICDGFEKAIDSLKPNSRDYVVIVTREHVHDATCIRSLMKYDEAVYTGMMGSIRRIGIVFSKLKEEGFDDARIDRIHAPIGLNIGSKTVEEIGISIISEIVKVRRLDCVNKALVDRGDHDMNSIKALATIHEPCAIATILKDEGSTPRSAGAVMAIFSNGRIIESIGGGFVEGKTIENAKAIIGSGRFEIITISMDDSPLMADGMVCGGRVTVLIEDFS